MVCWNINKWQIQMFWELDQHFKMKNDSNQMKTDSEWTIIFE